MPAVPSGTVTFLFTDIEGSTTRWEQHPEQMRVALARHDALLHEGIIEHGGVVITDRGEGDSFFALFARPTDALVAACAIQHALVAEPWAEEVAPLRVRMALHTGDAGLWEGRDYRGAAVNRCARLRAVAHGGQVLLSGATYELVRDHLPVGVTLRSLGDHRLRDLTRPEHIFQVVQPDLPADFPPLTTLDARRHNLPVQLTPLIGREREVAAVRERLLEPRTRLLTLTGPGGTGKTRLALQVAAEVLEAFPDGVFFIDLAPLSDPHLVLPTIAQTLGVVEQVAEPLIETLEQWLQGTRTLLVLDNLEQVIEAAPLVGSLLQANAALTVLVTSRVVLRVQGEREYPVPPLALPDPQHALLPEHLSAYEAVRLFIARAQDVKPDFAVTNETAPAVAEICVRLDGLPLAIELAAARIRVLPPQALLTRLGQRLTLLGAGARNLPARQQTLRATIDWSYNLLTPVEQILFVQLVVFVGGCTLDAVDTVCHVDGMVDVLEGVESLVAQSLLHQEQDASGEPRFLMLETLQEYAREKLEESGEAAALRRRHMMYYLDLAERAEPELTRARQGAWLSQLEDDHDNLRAALRWTQQSGERDLGLQLAGALARFWEVHGHLREGRGWLEGLLAPDTPSGQADVSRAQVKALHAAGSLAHVQGDVTRADELYERCVTLARHVNDRHRLARVLADMGHLALERGDDTRAVVLCTESEVLARDLGDAWCIAFALDGLGDVAVAQGAFGRAVMLLEESVAQFRRHGDRWGTAIGLNQLGRVAREQGDYDRATALYADSVALCRDLNDTRGAAWALLGWGDVARERGDAGQLTALSEESLALFQEQREQAGRGYALHNLAWAARAQGDLERAMGLGTESLVVFRQLGQPEAIAEVLTTLALLARERGNQEQAWAHFTESLTLSRTVGPKWVVADTLEGLAGLGRARQQAAWAATLFGAAGALREVKHIARWPVHQPRYELDVAAVREVLGTEQFAQAWAEGQAMPLEQAITEALAGLGKA